MKLIFFICFVISFITTLLIIPYWIKRAKQVNLTAKDMNKYEKPKVVEMGGLSVIIGFLLGILLLIAIEMFYFKSLERALQTMALLSSLLILTIIGLIDDILGWKIGLKQYQKPLLTLLAALPIIVINAGNSIISIPLVGRIDIGLFYPFLFIPIFIVFFSNAFNMLAGYNGLETSLGAIILATLGFIAWRSGYGWVAVIAIGMVASLIAFLFYNKFPAKIFPGDTLTYPIGALIAIIAIIGNMERIALILFTPYIVEFFIKAKYKFKTECFAEPQPDNSLEIKKIGSLTHIIIKILKKIKSKVYENDVVLTLIIFELFLAAFSIVYYW